MTLLPRPAALAAIAGTGVAYGTGIFCALEGLDLGAGRSHGSGTCGKRARSVHVPGGSPGGRVWLTQAWAPAWMASQGLPSGGV